MSAMAQILLIVAAIAVCLPLAAHFGARPSRLNRADTGGIAGFGGPDCGPGGGDGSCGGGDGGGSA